MRYGVEGGLGVAEDKLLLADSGLMKILLHLEMMSSKNIWNFLIPGSVMLDTSDLDAEQHYRTLRV